MKKKEQKISFHYLVPPFHFPDRDRLKEFIIKRMKKEGREAEAINYIFCDDEYLLQMNQQYLAHDTLTDIITFELSPKDQPVVSDIYISVERVKENATQFKVSFSAELLRVVFHGALHLMGYKDKSKEQAQVMREKEDEFLKAYNVSRGTKRKSKD
jgi:rRNA maturation RNase YbeY